jgi:hypothetical protein
VAETQPTNLAAELVAMRATVQVLIAVLETSGAPGLIEAVRTGINNTVQGDALVLPATATSREIYVKDIRDYALKILSETQSLAHPED